PNGHAHLIFAETEMVEEEIARTVAQHFVQRRPRGCGIKRRIEKLLDPCGVEVFCFACPGIAQWPQCAVGRVRPRRLALLHDDVTRDGGAVCARALARKLRMPGSRRGCSDLGKPEIGWPAVALGR